MLTSRCAIGRSLFVLPKKSKFDHLNVSRLGKIRWLSHPKDVPQDISPSSPSTNLPNIKKYIKSDQFDWGTVKEQIFGDFGKMPEKEPIKRVAYIPERFADEQTFGIGHEPDLDSDFLEFPGAGMTWHTPIVPKPIPVRIVGNSVYAVGRRKRATATIKMTLGEGNISVNGRHWMYYFKDWPVRNRIIEPLLVTEYLNKWDIQVHVHGGGFTGQSGAIRLAISRALLNWDPELQPPLKKAGFLTRDKREVERKKPGKRKARRSFQWVKR